MFSDILYIWPKPVYMITIEQEEKIGNFLALGCLLPIIFIKDTELKLYILIPLFVLLLLLNVRKYQRDKKAGKPVGRYYVGFGFMLLSMLVGIGTYFYMVNYQ